MTDRTTYQREYQRKRFGRKPRVQCPHGYKAKSHCAECRHAWDMNRYQRDKGKRRAANELWKKRNPERYATTQLAAKQRWLRMPEPTHPMPEWCECCGRTQTRRGVKRLDLDHDHFTGKFRGRLCNTCNRGIGMLGDSAEGLRRALNYLELR